MNFNEINLDLNPIKPYFLWMTGHSQTLLGHLIASHQFDRQTTLDVLKLSDGDSLGLHIYRGTLPYAVCLFHGLSGSHKSDYVQRTAKIAADIGFSVVMVDLRGTESVYGKAKKPYHSGRGEDAAQVIHYVRSQFPKDKVIAAGFSMSGSMVLNMLCQRHGDVMPDYGITVNAPIDLESASLKLNSGLNKIYDLRFYFLLKKMIDQFEFNEKLPTFGTTYLIDDKFTSKMCSFKNAQDYYEKCSAKKYLHQIKTPTFILTSQDDPFIDFKHYATAKWSDAVHKTFVPYGGHVGYLQKPQKMSPSGEPSMRWLDHYFLTVFNKILNLSQS